MPISLQGTPHLVACSVLVLEGPRNAPLGGTASRDADCAPANHSAPPLWEAGQGFGTGLKTQLTAACSPSRGPLGRVQHFLLQNLQERSGIQAATVKWL